VKAAEPPALQRLRFLSETVELEAGHLAATDARLFAEPFNAERAQRLRTDADLAERVDAFVARFGRLQDTLADRLLPALLQQLAESLGDDSGSSAAGAAGRGDWGERAGAGARHGGAGEDCRSGA
jgi:hypothetical protein